MSYSAVFDFERKIADFYNAPYAVAVDSCTHAIELALIYVNRGAVCPAHTYLSVPMTIVKLGMPLKFKDLTWSNFYFLNDSVIDAAVYWKKNGYVPGTFMCLSFQFKKHLNVGKGGMILCPDKESYEYLKKLAHDGRIPDVNWHDQDIDMIGYHYYMTPETAMLGLERFEAALNKEPRKWTWQDYPDLRTMSVFKT